MTAINSLYNGVCYASVSDANDAYYSSVPPAVTAGNTTYFSQFTLYQGVWKLWTNTCVSGTCTTQGYAFTGHGFPACDPSESFNDGMAMGWDVAGAMILALSVVWLKKIFWT